MAEDSPPEKLPDGSADAVTLEVLAARVGEEVGRSPWITVDQSMIDAFADLTNDHQFIHVDPDRARAETPFGGTIAHGFLTLSLLAPMAYAAQPTIAGTAMSVNAGFDRIRFLSPVKEGARVRGIFRLKALEERVPGEVTVTWEVTVEIEGAEKPALYAEWINRRYLTKR